MLIYHKGAVVPHGWAIRPWGQRPMLAAHKRLGESVSPGGISRMGILLRDSAIAVVGGLVILVCLSTGLRTVVQPCFVVFPDALCVPGDYPQLQRHL
jgi:hypothetical protein